MFLSTYIILQLLVKRNIETQYNLIIKRMFTYFYANILLFLWHFAVFQLFLQTFLTFFVFCFFEDVLICLFYNNLRIFSTALFVLLTRATCSSNPSIYSIINIYVIIGISRLRGTGNKNICGIYGTISTMFILLFENKLETLCASVYVGYYNILFL